MGEKGGMKTRRQLMAGMAGLWPMVCGAVPPMGRSGKARMRLSLAAYSFRDQFKDAAVMDFPKFIDYCAEQGCDGAELTSYYFPQDVSDEMLLAVRRHAFLRGVSVTGTAVGNSFALPDGPELEKEKAQVKRWIDRAAVLGAPHIRVFAGSAKGIDEAGARRQVIRALEEVGDYAASKGVWLGVENHGGVVATPEGLLEIVKAVQSRAVGINLDTGNFHGADPYEELARCAPWAVNVQVKVEVRRAGAKAAEPADLKRVAGILRSSGYQGWVVLEYESKEDPFVAVPEHLKALREALA